MCIIAAVIASLGGRDELGHGHVCMHVYECRHVCRHVYRHVHGHVYMYECLAWRRIRQRNLSRSEHFNGATQHHSSRMCACAYGGTQLHTCLHTTHLCTHVYTHVQVHYSDELDNSHRHHPHGGPCTHAHAPTHPRTHARARACTHMAHSHRHTR